MERGGMEGSYMFCSYSLILRRHCGSTTLEGKKIFPWLLPYSMNLLAHVESRCSIFKSRTLDLNRSGLHRVCNPLLTKTCTFGNSCYFLAPMWVLLVALWPDSSQQKLHVRQWGLEKWPSAASQLGCQALLGLLGHGCYIVWQQHSSWHTMNKQ